MVDAKRQCLGRGPKAPFPKKRVRSRRLPVHMGMYTRTTYCTNTRIYAYAYSPRGMGVPRPRTGPGARLPPWPRGGGGGGGCFRGSTHRCRAGAGEQRVKVGLGVCPSAVLTYPEALPLPGASLSGRAGPGALRAGGERGGGGGAHLGADRAVVPRPVPAHLRPLAHAPRSGGVAGPVALARGHGRPRAQAPARRAPVAVVAPADGNVGGGIVGAGAVGAADGAGGAAGAGDVAERARPPVLALLAGRAAPVPLRRAAAVARQRPRGAVVAQPDAVARDAVGEGAGGRAGGPAPRRGARALPCPREAAVARPVPRTGLRETNRRGLVRVTYLGSGSG